MPQDPYLPPGVTQRMIDVAYNQLCDCEEGESCPLCNEELAIAAMDDAADAAYDAQQDALHDRGD